MQVTHIRRRWYTLGIGIMLALVVGSVVALYSPVDEDRGELVRDADAPTEIPASAFAPQAAVETNVQATPFVKPSSDHVHAPQISAKPKPALMSEEDRIDKELFLFVRSVTKLTEEDLRALVDDPAAIEMFRGVVGDALSAHRRARQAYRKASADVIQTKFTA